MDKLLKGDRSISRLLAENPFPDAPPRMLRSSLYRYRFTKINELWSEGRWWSRTYVSPYCPTFGKQDPNQ
jgi:hypothetical protein